MPKPSTTRKVARVARTGGGRTARGQRSWFFPTLLTVVAVLGVFLIGFSRAQRQPDTSPPRIGDHWHSAIGFDICGSFVANVPDSGEDPLGIHTHGDGVVHTHPFSSTSAGRRATLGVFFDTVKAKVTATEIDLPNQEARRDGQKCGDKTARVRVKVWETRSPADKGRIFAGDPRSLHLSNNQLITVAFVPEGTDIPRPPTEAELDRLSDVGPSTTTTTPSSELTSTTTTTPPTSAPSTSTP